MIVNLVIAQGGGKRENIRFANLDWGEKKSLFLQTFDIFIISIRGLFLQKTLCSGNKTVCLILIKMQKKYGNDAEKI